MKKSRSTSDGMLVGGDYKLPKPYLTLTDKDLPAIKDWKVGKTYNMEIVVKMVHHSEGNEYSMDSDKTKEHRARFEVVSIDSMPEENAKSKK